jgi:hypothetical protein
MGHKSKDKPDYDFDFGLGDIPIFDFDINKEQQEITKEKTKRRTTVCYELSQKYEYRRAFSEISLLDACTQFDFKNGYSYNFITGGDVDSLSFLKAVLRQQNLEYCLFSTWCMAAEDILQFDIWLQQERIKKLDCYVGEIFPNSYRIEYEMLKNLIEKHQCGRVAVFRNHSKIYAGFGDKFYFGIQTSSNINTNPRTENASITIDKGIFEFYKTYFDGIKSFE